MTFDPEQPRDDHGQWSREGAETSFAVVQRVADRLGFPSAAVTVYQSQGPALTVGSQQFVKAGEFDPVSKRISLYRADPRIDVIDEGIVAHEILHAMQDAVDDAPSLKDMRADPVTHDALMREGGVSTYSDSYWKLAEREMPGNTYSQAHTTALHETLAEIARADQVSSTGPKNERAMFESNMRVSHPTQYRYYQTLREEYGKKSAYERSVYERARARGKRP